MNDAEHHEHHDRPFRRAAKLLVLGLLIGVLLYVGYVATGMLP